MLSEYELDVNGRKHKVMADPETPLLYILRNDLNLKATKFGCGKSQCGACTVDVGANPVRSCVTPVSAVNGPVTTLEGLSKGKDLHALQQAMIAKQAPQCAYCISGIIMSAACLLKSNAKPSEADVNTALSDHLCRCGAHGRIVAAVTQAVTNIQQ
jgi:aerobic-type carbon monoxide dehydrogenase small subunit (CoxS/CutS family)